MVKIGEDRIFQRIVMRLLKELLLDVMRERMTDDDSGNPMLTMDNIAEYYAYSITFGISKWVQKGMQIEVDAVLEALKVLLSESLLDLIHRRGGKQNPSNVSKK